MKTITISPLYKKDIEEITTYNKDIDGITVSITVIQLWRQGSFEIEIPETKKEINEWKKSNAINDNNINSNLLIERYIKQEDFISLNDIPFVCELQETYDCCSIDYEYSNNFPEHLKEEIETFLEENTFSELEDIDWYIDDNNYILNSPYNIEI
jgi:hypothetical protein